MAYLSKFIQIMTVSDLVQVSSVEFYGAVIPSNHLHDPVNSAVVHSHPLSSFFSNCHV